MSSLSDAIEEISRRSGLVAADHVERVDVDPTGMLHVTCRFDGAPHWYRWQDGRIEEVFPTSDRRLALGRLLAGSSDWRLLAYRPGRRVVVESRRDGEPVVLKGYRRRRSRPAARVHAIAETALCGTGLGIPRLLEHDSEHETLVFERVEGTPLGFEAPGEFEGLGAALRRFQASPCDDDLPAFDSAAELQVLARWSERFALACDRLPDGWAEVHERVVGRAPSFSDAELVPCHRDLHVGQFLLTPSGPLVLDFDLFCRADPALDCGNLLAHLRLRHLQHLPGADERRIEACARSLLRGLDGTASRPLRDGLPFYQATTFLRLSLVYGLRPRWSDLSPRLVELAELCLFGLAGSK